MGWIKYKYTCRYSSTGVCICSDPYVDVDLLHNGKKLTVTGMIDSGCGITHANSDIADFFGIDLTKCSNINVGGATGSEVGQITNIFMQLKDNGDSFETPIIFTRGLPVPLLLGQDNFFEKFDIKFEKRNNTFELKRNK